MIPTSDQRKRDLDNFYHLMTMLQQYHGDRNLSECGGNLLRQKKGVYFFFEPGEVRHGSNVLRVVRVGTHGLKRGSRRTLWDRLKDHRGSTSGGGGNHRGSVFRKLVGKAIIEKYDLTGNTAATWGQGNSAPREIRVQEKDLEKQVSLYIDELPFVWVEIDDPAGPDSRRKFIEKHSIALLSNITGNPDLPSGNWLGTKCPHEDIKKSGLWNSDHVREDYDPEFLIELKEYIEKQIIPKGTEQSGIS